MSVRMSFKDACRSGKPFQHEGWSDDHWAIYDSDIGFLKNAFNSEEEIHIIPRQAWEDKWILKKPETIAQRKIRRAKEYNPALNTPEEIAVTAIEMDILDRRGLKSEWAEISERVIEEDIKPAWIDIIKECFKAR